MYVSQWLWETSVISPMSDSEIKITEWLSANSHPGPSGFKAISVASSASGQGQENQGENRERDAALMVKKRILGRVLWFGYRLGPKRTIPGSPGGCSLKAMGRGDNEIQHEQAPKMTATYYRPGNNCPAYPGFAGLCWLYQGSS